VYLVISGCPEPYLANPLTIQNTAKIQIMRIALTLQKVSEADILGKHLLNYHQNKKKKPNEFPKLRVRKSAPAQSQAIS